MMLIISRYYYHNTRFGTAMSLTSRQRDITGPSGQHAGAGRKERHGRHAAPHRRGTGRGNVIPSPHL